MRHLIMLAGAIAMVATTPLLAQGQGRGRGHGGAHPGFQPRASHACPPGLARQGTGCLPPGQARRLFDVGQRIPTSFRYSQIPDQYLNQVVIDPRYRYTYNDGVVYVVDPSTRLVQSIIDLID